MRNEIICGDFQNVIWDLPHATVIFADPPDNCGLKYEGFTDINKDYGSLLTSIIQHIQRKSDIGWLSYYYKYQQHVWQRLRHINRSRQFMWRFTFGQHRQTDCGNGYRPIMRIMQPEAVLYPDAIRVQSARQKQGDKRADPRGRVPDDVWEFPRVVGNARERRPWHPTQHPEALIERIVKFSTKPGDLVIDMFGGTGTVNRVCKRLDRQCIGIEISPVYCEKIREELKTL